MKEVRIYNNMGMLLESHRPGRQAFQGRDEALFFHQLKAQAGLFLCVAQG